MSFARRFVVWPERVWGIGDMEQRVTEEHLTLLEAFLRWCDPKCLEEIRTAQRMYTASEWAACLEPLLVDLRELNQNPQLLDPCDFRSYFAHREAWENATKAFCLRFTGGELTMTAVELTADFNNTRQEIPALYAAHMKYDFKANTGEIAGKCYVAIEVSAGATGAPKVAIRDELGSSPRGCSKGRPKFPRAEFVAIARVTPRASNNKRTADLLLAVFRQNHSARKAPTNRTVFDHVSEIYGEVAKFETPLNPPNHFGGFSVV